MTTGRKRPSTILGRPKKLKTSDEPEVIRRYVEMYWTIDELASSYIVSVNCIVKILDRHGVRRRTAEEVGLLMHYRRVGTPVTEEGWDRRIEEETARIRESWSEKERVKRLTKTMQPLPMMLSPIRTNRFGHPLPGSI